MMTGKSSVLDAARSALMSDPTVDLHNFPISMGFEEGTLTLEGEVESVAAKKLALEAVVALPEVTGVVDRLRVKPAEHMGDGQIRELVRDALLQEPAFEHHAIRETAKGETVTLREPAIENRGWIEIEVVDGVVTLNGEVLGLDEKRLAGVLAWWVPGSRDVVNGLAVNPPEEDSFDLIAEGVRLALDKDPFVDASQLRVGVRGSVVTLAGILPSETQRHMAECDAWYVFGVDKVINNIDVRAG